MTRNAPLVALLPAALAACGDDGGVHTLDDAPPFDVPPDVAPGTATVTLRLGRIPLANHTVYFQGPDSTEIATVMTDATGTATAIVPPDSSVTVLGLRDIANPAITSIVTVMGVSPGDHLRIDGSARFPQETIDFTWSAYTGVASPSYGISTTCGGDGLGEGTTGGLHLDRCSPRIDVLAYARDAAVGGPPLAYAAKLDQPFGAVDLTGETWTAMPMVGSTYTSIPLTTSVHSSRHIVTPRGRIAGCSATPQSNTSTYAPVMPCPNIAGTTTFDTLLFTDHQTTFEVTHRITTASPAFDLAGSMIKAPASSGAFDTTTRVLIWKETAGATPDFMTVFANKVSGAAPYFYWDIMAPYRGDSLTLPALVGEAAPFVLGNEANPVITTGTATGGYDAIRVHGPFYMDGLTDEIERIVVGYQYDG